MDNTALVSLIVMFAPILTYSLTTAFFKLFQKLTFEIHAIITAVAVAGNLIAVLYLMSFPLALIGIAQLLVAVVFFVCAIFFLGGKVGHETIFAFVALLGTVPISNSWGVPGLIAGIVVFVLMITIFTHREKENLRNFIGGEFVNVMSALNAGDIGGVYDTLPDKKDVAAEISKQRTFSMIPTALTIAVFGLLWNLLGLPPSPLPPVF